MFEELAAAIFGCFVLLCFCQLCLKWCCKGNEAETHNNAPTNTQHRSEDDFYSIPRQSSPPQALPLEDMSQLERDELPTWLRVLRMPPPSNYRSQPIRTAPLNDPETIFSDMSQLERDELPTWLRELTMSQPSNYRSQPIRTAPLNYPETNDLLHSSSPRPHYHRTRSYSLTDLPPSYAEATGQTQQATVQPQRHCASEINVREAETHNNAPTNTQHRSEDDFYSIPRQSSPPQALLLEDMSQLERDELPTWLRVLRMPPPSNYRSQPIRTAPLNDPETIFSDMSQLERDELPTWLRELTMSQPSNYRSQPIRTAPLNYPETNDLLHSSSPRPHYHRTRSYSLTDLPPSYAEATGQTQQATVQPQRHCASEINVRGNT